MASQLRAMIAQHARRLALVAAVAFAQTVSGQTARSGWLPRQERLAAELTAAQRAEALAVVDRIVRVFQRVPELANPSGFEIQPTVSGGVRPLGPDGQVKDQSVMEYVLTLSIYRPSKVVAGEGCGCIEIRINQYPAAELRDASGRPIYVESPRAREPVGSPEEKADIFYQVPVALQVYGELWGPKRDITPGRPERSGASVLLVGDGELPWLPVSRETFYEAARIEREGKDGRKQDGMRAGLAKTPYEHWIAEAPQRKEIRDGQLAAARRSLSAAEYEKFRQTIEDTDRQVAEQLRKQDAVDRETNRTSVNKMNTARDAFQIELDRMTPDERRMPTYINDGLTEGPIATGRRIVSNPAPPAWRVFTPNENFFRARRSPVEVRSIRVHIGISGTGLVPSVRNALLKTFQTLDWGAIKALAEPVR
jgi:hypothetical protein